MGPVESSAERRATFVSVLARRVQGLRLLTLPELQGHGALFAKTVARIRGGESVALIDVL